MGEKLPNAWKLHDTLGNVWEWVADWFQEDYYRKLSSSTTDPKGPAKGCLRVLRGGSWVSLPWIVRASFRSRYDPVSRGDYCGVRCARELIP